MENIKKIDFDMKNNLHETLPFIICGMSGTTRFQEESFVHYGWTH